MALVDYTSASEASASDSEPNRDPGSEGRGGPAAAKRRKTSHPAADTDKDRDAAAAGSSLPPLPAAFHDLYASTVRPSNVDDPSLHQGRRRQIPHVVGRWPSHLYIEWRPTGPEHAVLTSLIEGVLSRWREQSQHQHREPRRRDGVRPTKKTAPNAPAEEARDPDAGGGTDDDTIATFLTSDLGAPLPLHISLSRPLSLATAEKDEFLERLQRDLLAVAPSLSSNSRSGAGGFMLRPTALEWHRSGESERSFLVLRVQSESSGLGTAEEAVADKGGQQGVDSGRTSSSNNSNNPELSTLLGLCNRLCRTYKQAELYAYAADATAPPGGGGNGGGGGGGEGRKGGRGTESGGGGSGDGGGKEKATTATAVGDAFHVSLAWTFAAPTAALRRATDEAFAAHAGRVRAMRLPVDGVKAKIGNVVTHIGLSSSSLSTPASSFLPGRDGDRGHAGTRSSAFGFF